jgi:uncharacterized protein
VTFWRALLAAWLALLATAATAQTFPKFTGLVVDDANVLSAQTKADLTAKLQALQSDTKRQLVVATIPDLQGYGIAEYGYKLGRVWGVGLKDVNNGAILIVAPKERKVRIEVGTGLEPILTDAYSSVVINNTITPKFKAGDLNGGVTAGVDALIQQLRASPEEAQARLDAAVQEFNRTHERRSSGGGVSLNFIFVIVVILFFFVFPLIGRAVGGRRYHRSGVGDAVSSVGQVILWSALNSAMNGGRDDDDHGGFFGGGGGGGSSGGWGGGGFSGGGGGSFGGGGASGSW